MKGSRTVTGSTVHKWFLTLQNRSDFFCRKKIHSISFHCYIPLRRGLVFSRKVCVM